VERVLLTDGCADPYNPKTIRASMGAIFDRRFSPVSIPELIELKAGRRNGFAEGYSKAVKVIGTAAGSDCTDISKVCLNNSIIAIGSEGCGLSDEILALCDEMARVPMSPGCESLNVAVAAAIVMWEARRRGEPD